MMDRIVSGLSESSIKVRLAAVRYDANLLLIVCQKTFGEWKLPLYNTIQKITYLFYEINIFILQRRFHLIKSDNHFLFFFKQIVILNFLFIRESWKKCHGFLKNMKQHNCIQYLIIIRNQK